VGACLGLATAILVASYATIILAHVGVLPDWLSTLGYFVIVALFVLVGGEVAAVLLSASRRTPWAVRALPRGIEVRLATEGTFLVPWEDIASASVSERRLCYRKRDGKGTETFVLLSTEQFAAATQNDYFPVRLLG
jgi:uncharacterized membrane protein